MSDKVITINIKKSGDIQINICQSNNSENENRKESEKPIINICQSNNGEIENRKESEKSITEIIGDIRQELDYDNPLIQKST